MTEYLDLHSGTEVFKFGFSRQGFQRFRCRTCRKTFSDIPARPLDDMRIEPEKGFQVVKMLCEGLGIRAIERLTGLNRRTVLGVLETAGSKCQDLLNAKIRGVKADKRSCLDIFKLKVKDANIQFVELRERDTSVLDNGEFDRSLIALFHKIKMAATEARRREGDATNDGDSDASIKAFDLWEPVYRDCVQLEKDFYNHPKLTWAKKKVSAAKRKEVWIGILTGILITLCTPVDAFQHWAIHTWHHWFPPKP